MQSNSLENFLDWPEAVADVEAPSPCLSSMQEALETTLPHAQTYLQAHTFADLERNEEAMAATVKLAVVRLEWLLDDARQGISGMFSQEEFTLLLNCFQGKFLTPDDCQRLASSVCDDLGIELDSYRESGIAEFVDKLRTLTAPQRAALADALEVAWHSGRPVAEALADLGIELR